MRRNKLIVGIGLLLIGVFALHGLATAEDEYVLEWQVSSAGSVPFSFPRGVAVDSAGSVYVADSSNNRIVQFDSDGHNPVVWPLPPGGCYIPYDIAVHSGNVYVTNYQTGCQSIHKFDSDGNCLDNWSIAGSCPYGIGGDPVSGYVFVANSCTPDTIMIFDVNGTPQSLPDGDLSSYGYYDARDIASDSQGNFFVVDGGFNHYIHMFTSTGQHLATWEFFDLGTDDFEQPNRIAVDSKGYLYVTDTGHNRILKLSVDKSIPSSPTLHLEAELNGSLYTPVGISVDWNGNIYVTDHTAGNHRILKFIPTAIKKLKELITEVALISMQSLDAKLDNTLAALEAKNADNREDAINKMQAFINVVEAQRGNKLTDTQANDFIAMANEIISLL